MESAWRVESTFRLVLSEVETKREAKHPQRRLYATLRSIVY